MCHGRFIILLAIFLASGCLIRNVNFDPPSYSATTLDRTPDAVLAAFTREYPAGKIERIESRKWIDDVQHYRVIFRTGDELREIAFREDGTMIDGTDRALDRG